MEHLVQQEKQSRQLAEQTDNDILKALDGYLNSKSESERDDTQENLSHDIPSPIMKENGMWTIPGTTREFKSSTAAYLAISRYREYQIQNNASMLMYGLTYDEYIHQDGTSKSNTETAESSEPEPTDNIPVRTGNEPVPETPADYTTTS